MNRIRGFVTGAVLLFAMASMGQQSPAPGTQPMPSVEDHVKFLSQQLGLTADQQAKVTPVIREMQDTAEKANADASLSPEERHNRLRAAHMKADKEMRTVLTEPQKAKLTQMEQDAHMDAGQGQK